MKNKTTQFTSKTKLTAQKRSSFIPSHKINRAVATAAIGLGLITAAYAGNGPSAATVTPIPSAAGAGGNNNNSAVVAAIHQLGNRIEALSTAKEATQRNTEYQQDGNLPLLEMVNNNKFAIASKLKQQNNANTVRQISLLLSQFPDSALTYNIKSQDVLDAAERSNNRDKLTDQLTLGSPASDTLYTDLLGTNNYKFYNGYTPDGYTVSKPAAKDMHNDYMSFSNLFSPSAYTPNQQVAAQFYSKYLTSEYQPIASKINFDKLTSYLNKFSSNPQKLANALYSFVSSPQYEAYQLKIRTQMASRSVEMSNLNHLILERTPLETQQPDQNLATISQAVGVTPKQVTLPNPNNPTISKKVYAYASPLQISNYVANHRVNSSAWYKKMQTASPATVQRETLFVLAEIESQMQQAHLDRERILSTLTATQLFQSNQYAMFLQNYSQPVNKLLDGLIKKDATIKPKS